MIRKTGIIVLLILVFILVCVSCSKSANSSNGKEEKNREPIEAIGKGKVSENNEIEMEIINFQNEYIRSLHYFSEKEYMNTLNILKGIPQRYIDVSSKIREVASIYIQGNLEKADSYISEKRYKEAVECLNVVTEIYKDEKDTINLDKTLEGTLWQSTDRAKLLEKSIDLKKSYPVSILMYHSISDEPGNDLCVIPEKFRSEMKYLKDTNFNIIHFDDLYWYFSKDIPIPPKTVIVSLDDGYADNYTNAYPVVKELGIKATVFVITSTIDKHPLYLTSSQIKEMDANNFHVESHTANHDMDKKLASLSYNVQLQSFEESKEILENLLNRKAETICYPFGSYNSDTIKAAEAAGYKLGVTIESGRAEKSNGLFTLRRIYVGNSYSVDLFKELVRY